KKIGFAIAYCDNDTSEHRENFIGSVFVDGNDKDRGWKDAGIFGTIELKE
ncbi:CBM9 family sugar-binding protein, partial [Candidatus Woesearchaeota archaeon]|nr:CBM9 family sugar-binding protein [Candidatus Woesearchaeota archaeon]